jgi:hypothetical protein
MTPAAEAKTQECVRRRQTGGLVDFLFSKVNAVPWREWSILTKLLLFQGLIAQELEFGAGPRSPHRTVHGHQMFKLKQARPPARLREKLTNCQSHVRLWGCLEGRQRFRREE